MEHAAQHTEQKIRLTDCGNGGLQRFAPEIHAEQTQKPAAVTTAAGLEWKGDSDGT